MSITWGLPGYILLVSHILVLLEKSWIKLVSSWKRYTQKKLYVYIYIYIYILYCTIRLFHLLLIIWFTITHKGTSKVTLNFHLYHYLLNSFKFAKFEKLPQIFFYWKSISDLLFWYIGNNTFVIWRHLRKIA